MIHLTLSLIFVLACFVLPSRAIFLGINCGHPIPYNTPGGDLFEADRQYTHQNGFGYIGDNSRIAGPDRIIGGSENLDELYYVRREGEFCCLFDIPAG